MKKYILSLAMLTLFSAQAWSESWFKDANIYARMGYSIGGTPCTFTCANKLVAHKSKTKRK